MTALWEKRHLAAIVAHVLPHAEGQLRHCPGRRPAWERWEITQGRWVPDRHGIRRRDVMRAASDQLDAQANIGIKPSLGVAAQRTLRWTNRWPRVFQAIAPELTVEDVPPWKSGARERTPEENVRQVAERLEGVEAPRLDFRDSGDLGSRILKKLLAASVTRVLADIRLEEIRDD